MTSRFQTFIFDFDSTIVSGETLDLIAEEVLADNPNKATIIEEVRAITNRGMNGELTIEESLSRRLSMIRVRRAHLSIVTEALTKRISTSFLAHAAFFQENSANIHVVSSGFTDLIVPTTNILGIQRSHVHANDLLFDEEGYVKGVDPASRLSKHLGKVREVESLRLERPIVIIGDGYTDYEIKKHGAADFFVAYVEHARREKVIGVADLVVGSFEPLLQYFQGRGV